eukprot:TRINITY_DN20484_c0_g1_i2.p2 TRINITY_DN20484_c0_g1~~TRINITY_DN20484_c0_g1_i2.p2  ORF type:complete len:729 (+),score=257.04 TRINITY_DN20484_c0_g1_i2:232-2187(+)
MQPGKKKRPEDWVCGHCNNRNFANRVSCNRCGAAMDALSKPAGDDSSGDWYCPKCDQKNWNSNRECYKCQGPRPIQFKKPRKSKKITGMSGLPDWAEQDPIQRREDESSSSEDDATGEDMAYLKLLARTSAPAAKSAQKFLSAVQNPGAAQTGDAPKPPRESPKPRKLNDGAQINFDVSWALPRQPGYDGGYHAYSGEMQGRWHQEDLFQDTVQRSYERKVEVPDLLVAGRKRAAPETLPQFPAEKRVRSEKKEKRKRTALEKGVKEAKEAERFLDCLDASCRKGAEDPASREAKQYLQKIALQCGGDSPFSSSSGPALSRTFHSEQLDGWRVQLAALRNLQSKGTEGLEGAITGLVGKIEAEEELQRRKIAEQEAERAAVEEELNRYVTAIGPDLPPEIKARIAVRAAPPCLAATAAAAACLLIATAENMDEDDAASDGPGAPLRAYSAEDGSRLPKNDPASQALQELLARRVAAAKAEEQARRRRPPPRPKPRKPTTLGPLALTIAPGSTPPLVQTVMHGRNAGLAGVMVGDRISRVDYVPVRTREALLKQFKGKQAGEVVRLSLLRTKVDVETGRQLETDEFEVSLTLAHAPGTWKQWIREADKHLKEGAGGGECSSAKDLRDEVQKMQAALAAAEKELAECEDEALA